MASYHAAVFLHQVNDDVFLNGNNPGAIAPISGIYRCRNCGYETVCRRGARLPGASHHEHELEGSGIVWELIVASANS